MSQLVCQASDLYTLILLFVYKNKKVKTFQSEMDAKSGLAPSLMPPVMEDDSIFGPPALSAYSIAILSAHSSSQHRLSSSPLSGAELKENTELKDSLKRKLSVHFGDSESSFFLHRVNFDSQALNQTRTSKDVTHSTSTTRNFIHESKDSISTHATSPGLTSYSSGSSLWVRPACSPNAHNSFNNMTDDGQDNLSSSRQLEKNNVKLHSISGSTMSGVDGRGLKAKDLTKNQMILQQGGIPYKKSKLSHNLRSLGPPKRASEILERFHDQDDMSIEIGRNRPLMTKEDSLFAHPKSTFDLKFNKNAANHFIGTELTPDTETLSQYLLSKSKESTRFNALKFKKSEFIKGLENLKDRSPKPYMQLVSSPRNTLVQGSFHLKGASSKPRDTLRAPDDQNLKNVQTSPPKFHDLSRKPLHDVSNFDHDAERKDHFVKPLIPRSVSTIGAHDTNRPNISVVGSESMNNTLKKTITVNSNQYEKLEILGRGGSSKVYRVRHVNSRKIFAIKKVDYDKFDESCIDGFKSEIEHLQKLKNHPRVVTLEDHSIENGSIFLVMECGEVDLAHVLQKRLSGEPHLDVNFVRFHALEIFRCVQAVHQAGIVHSDLKPANFLFVQGLMKIIDFGIANAVPEHTANIYRESQIGTPNYMAPETLIEVGQANCPSNKDSFNVWRVGKSSDVWSCGCIIYQMIYGKPPYAAYTGQKRIQAIMDPKTKISFSENGLGGVKVPPSAIILMQGCLDRLPNSRWSIEECLASDFLKPKVVSRAYVRDLIYSAINFGMENKGSGILREEYDEMVETVVKQIEDLNFA